MNIERVMIYLFLIAVSGYGLLGLVAPHRLLQKKGDWWGFDWMTGRAFYTSTTRVRITCGVLLGMAVALMAMALLAA